MAAALQAQPARPGGTKRRGTAGLRWHADEADIKVARRWSSLYRAIDREGNLIQAMLNEQRDMAAAQRFFRQALAIAE